MSKLRNWEYAANILCVRLDALGDVLMTTPALRALKETCPARRLTLLTSPAATPLASLVPEIDDVIVYDAPWMKATAPRHDSRPDKRMIRRLRRGRFDAAVIFTVYSQNPLPAALLCYLADIPLRLAHCHENPYQLLSDWIIDKEPQAGIRHEVQRQLDLVATIGCRTTGERLSLRVPAAARHKIRAHLDRIGIEPDGRWVVIHPGASAPSRRYPLEGFIEVARRLRNDHGCRVVVTGADGECHLAECLQRAVGIGCDCLAGCLDLPELAALLEAAPVVICNNTGPAHVAAAVGTPVVDLYALTNPQHTPWGVPSRVLNHDVPCKYCYKSVCPQLHHDCLRKVTPEQVVAAACELLAEANIVGSAAVPSAATPLVATGGLS